MSTIETRNVAGEVVRVTEVGGKTVRLTYGARIRTFGGWYQHTRVEAQAADGSWAEIGRLQTRRRNKRTDALSCRTNGGCVLGLDLRWVVGVAA
jgi:hypothetical protein